MGQLVSSQSQSNFPSVHPSTRSRLSKPPPSELVNPSSSVSKSDPLTPTGVGGMTASTDIKEKQTLYQHMMQLTPPSKRKTKKYALIVRGLITGQPTAIRPKVTKTVARPQLIQVKSHLAESKYANPIIAELRTLSPSGDHSLVTAELDQKDKPVMVRPMHAVCLPHPDAEAHRHYFSNKSEGNSTGLDLFSLATTNLSVERLWKFINEVHIIDFINSPDFGLGQPGDGSGILAGAVPTPETIINGFEQITPELMTLGFAIGENILPDHKGVCMHQCFTESLNNVSRGLSANWSNVGSYLCVTTLQFNFDSQLITLKTGGALNWYCHFHLLLFLQSVSRNYTILFDQASENPLQSVHSISGAVMNFLAALSLMNNGIREILPFIRYIAQFADSEFEQIQKQNRGKGVVCAATWWD